MTQTLVRSNKNKHVSLLVAVILGASGQLCHGTLIPLSFEGLTQKSKHVVTGKVIRLRSYRERLENVGELIVTDVTIAVKSQLKGSFTQKELTLQVPGGTVGKTREIWPEAAQFSPGEQVLVFVRQVKGKLMITGWQQGKYRLSTDGATVLGKSALPIGRRIPLFTVASQVRLYSASPAPRGPQPSTGGER